MKNCQHWKSAAAATAALFTLLVQAAPSPIDIRSVSLVKRDDPSTIDGFTQAWSNGDKGPPPVDADKLSNPCYRFDLAPNADITTYCVNNGIDLTDPRDQAVECCLNICKGKPGPQCNSFAVYTKEGTDEVKCCTYKDTLTISDKNGENAENDDSVAWNRITTEPGWTGTEYGDFAILANKNNPDGVAYMGNRNPDIPIGTNEQDAIKICIDYCKSVNERNRNSAIESSTALYRCCLRVFVYEQWTPGPTTPLNRRCTLWGVQHEGDSSRNYGPTGRDEATSTNREGVAVDLDSPPSNDGNGYCYV